MKPLFITFEGLDGSGKSTHLRRAAEWLQARGVSFCQTHEPGGTPLGDAIRGVFLDPVWGRLDGRVELLMVFASRRQHLMELVDPALEAGRLVLCDRFTDSTHAYQGFGRGVPQELIREVDRLATGGRRPALTLLFDLPALVAQRRGQSSTRRKKGGVDRLDAEELAFYERVREGFRSLAEAEPERFRIIDASGSKEETWEQVQRQFEALDLGAGPDVDSGSDVAEAAAAEIL